MTATVPAHGSVLKKISGKRRVVRPLSGPLVLSRTEVPHQRDREGQSLLLPDESWSDARALRKQPRCEAYNSRLRHRLLQCSPENSWLAGNHQALCQTLS